jgi:hypothetical protein
MDLTFSYQLANGCNLPSKNEGYKLTSGMEVTYQPIVCI